MDGRDKDSPSTGSRQASEGGRCPFCGSEMPEEVAARIQPNRKRMLQVARTEGRKLFGKARKEVFLQWFGLTGNLGIAAEKAGVTRQTVSKHRLSDPEFEADYNRAIELGVPDLKARLLSFMNGRPKLDIVGELEPPDDADFDPQLAVQVLREQERMMNAGGIGVGRPRKTGRVPRVATNAEVAAALVKRLVTFGIRVAKEEGGTKKG